MSSRAKRARVNDDNEYESIHRSGNFCIMRFNRLGASQSFYVSLLYAFDPNKVNDIKVPTLVDISKTPLEDVIDHNQGITRFRFAGRSGNIVTRIQQIIGPIDTLEEALSIQAEWKSKSRGLAGRGDEGRELANKRRKPCWDAMADKDYEKMAKRVNKKNKNK